MRDRGRIAALLEQGNSSFTGEDILSALESAGYQVIPTRMVPQLDDLVSMQGAAHRPQPV